jgi:hypothetical protein
VQTVGGRCREDLSLTIEHGKFGVATRFSRGSRKGKGIDNFIYELFLDGDDIRNGMLEIRQDCVYLPISTDCASAFTN